MRGAARLGRLQVALTLACLATIVAGAAVAISSVTLAPGSLHAVADACGEFLPSARSALAFGGLSLLALPAVVMGLGVRSLALQLRATRRHLRSLEPTGESVQVGSSHCELLAERAPLAFCAGLRSPRIYISRGAVEQLSERELRAVVAHERHHLQRRDPLRLLTLRTLADAFVFVPVFKAMSERFGALIELSADQAAVDAVGSRAPIASALLHFTPAPGGSSAAIAGIAAERVDQLCGDPGASGWRLPPAAVGSSAASVSFLALAVVWLAESGGSKISLLLAVQSCMPAMALAVGLLAMFMILRVGAGSRTRT